MRAYEMEGEVIRQETLQIDGQTFNCRVTVDPTRACELRWLRALRLLRGEDGDLAGDPAERAQRRAA